MCKNTWIPGELGQDAKLGPLVVGGDQLAARRGPKARAKLRARRNALQIGLRARRPTGGGPDGPKARMQPPGLGMHMGQKRLAVGGHDPLVLPVLHDPKGGRVRGGLQNFPAHARGRTPRAA